MALLLSTFLSVLLGIQATNNYDAEVYLGKRVVVDNMMKHKEPMNLEAVSDFVLNRPPHEDSAEYEEWRSELLFSLFLNYPQEMVSFLSSVPFKLRNEIYYELHFPVNDGIPITELREKIHSEVKGYDDIKEQLDIVFLYVKNCHGPRDFSFLQETN